MPRAIRARYVDPLAEIWLACARQVGLQVVRSPAAYAATDGRGVLIVGDEPSLDADDSLAQMIFHELCHSLVEGPDAFARPDWGMDNVGDDDLWREHGCLRLQWVLAGRYGLRELFAPTTDHRPAFWDQLGDDPLGDRDAPSVQAAIRGLTRVGDRPWAPALTAALEATAALARQVDAALARAPTAAPAPGELPSLWQGLTAPPPPHPTGLPAGLVRAERSCGTCAWRYQGGPGRKAERCRHTTTRIDLAWPGCERWEPAGSVDCQRCGACCRAAYQSVEVGRRERFVRQHPDLVVDRGSYLEIQRAGDRCAALVGGEAVEAAQGPRVSPYACVVYPDRPRTCRDFTLGSEHCLTARQRVGLTIG